MIIVFKTAPPSLFALSYTSQQGIAAPIGPGSPGRSFLNQQRALHLPTAFPSRADSAGKQPASAARP